MLLTYQFGVKDLGTARTGRWTPTLFFAAWAQRCIERFRDDETQGDAFLNLHWKFPAAQCTSLGLMYPVHCDYNARIESALQV